MPSQVSILYLKLVTCCHRPELGKIQNARCGSHETQKNIICNCGKLQERKDKMRTERSNRWKGQPDRAWDRTEELGTLGKRTGEIQEQLRSHRERGALLNNLPFLLRIQMNGLEFVDWRWPYISQSPGPHDFWEVLLLGNAMRSVNIWPTKSFGKA